MNSKNLILFATLIMAATVGCGKKSKSDSTTSTATTTTTTDTTTTTPAPAATVAAVYSDITTQMSALHATKYNATTLNLADDTWTADDWGVTARFNCFGDCNGSITPKEFVDEVLDPSKKGTSGDIVKKLDVFCYIGAMITPSQMDGALPKVAAKHAVTIDDTIKAALTTNCGADAQTLDHISGMTIYITVTAAAGGIFDRLVVFSGASDDSDDMPFYLKNSGGIISVAEFEHSKDNSGNAGISRTMFKFNKNTDEFQFEYFSLIPATGTDISTGGSLDFGRGYHNSKTGEIAFVSDMGNAAYNVNHTFVAVSANDNEAQIGAYFSRASEDNTALTGAFVCFNKTTGAFVNDTGCTENSSLARKIPWSSTSDLFTTIHGKALTDWELSATTDVANFDSTTIATLAPNYK